MFHWSNMHVIDENLDNAQIRVDDTNRSKENVPPPLPVLYTKNYLIAVPKIISYANTSHFFIVFVEVLYA